MTSQGRGFRFSIGVWTLIISDPLLVSITEGFAAYNKKVKKVQLLEFIVTSSLIISKINFSSFDCHRLQVGKYWYTQSTHQWCCSMIVLHIRATGKISHLNYVSRLYSVFMGSGLCGKSYWFFYKSSWRIQNDMRFKKEINVV